MTAHYRSKKKDKDEITTGKSKKQTSGLLWLLLGNPPSQEISENVVRTAFLVLRERVKTDASRCYMIR